MKLIQRKKNIELESLVASVSEGPLEPPAAEDSDRSKHRSHFRQSFLSKVVIVAILLLVSLKTLISLSDDVQSIGHRVKIQRSEFVLFVDMLDRSIVLVTKCDPRQKNGGKLHLWLEGDTLTYIPLYQQREHSIWNKWYGMIESLPSITQTGEYQLKGLWTGCKDEIEEPENDILLPWTFFSSQDTSLEYRTPNYGDFSNGYWVQWKALMTFKSNISLPIMSPSSPSAIEEYTWIDPNAKSFTLIQENDLFLYQEGVVDHHNKFYDFHELSNYELVCWIGSESAKLYHSSFLSLRPHLFPHQRPFKFHYYPSYSFLHPDQTWGDELDQAGLKQKFRKCKHILVSFDEPEVPLSQCEYRDQMINFIHHLEYAFSDETFPIWIFTTMESPLRSANCHSKCTYLPSRSTNHPCNDILQDIFSSSPFSSRVQLMNNTDVSIPVTIRETEEQRQIRQVQRNVSLIIALRTFVLVGKKVHEWRQNHQEGKIDGLHRGNVVEPNFELVAYNWTMKWEEVNEDPFL